MGMTIIGQVIRLDPNRKRAYSKTTSILREHLGKLFRGVIIIGVRKEVFVEDLSITQGKSDDR